MEFTCGEKNDTLLIPINDGLHWTLLLMSGTKRTIRFLLFTTFQAKGYAGVKRWAQRAKVEAALQRYRMYERPCFGAFKEYTIGGICGGLLHQSIAVPSR